MEFKDLPLHDGLVRTISTNWSGKSAEFLDCFLKPNQSARPCLLTFSGISSINVPMATPWGESNVIRTKADRHVYVMSSDYGNSDGGTGDIGNDEYSH